MCVCVCENMCERECVCECMCVRGKNSGDWSKERWALHLEKLCCISSVDMLYRSFDLLGVKNFLTKNAPSRYSQNFKTSRERQPGIATLLHHNCTTIAQHIAPHIAHPNCTLQLHIPIAHPNCTFQLHITVNNNSAPHTCRFCQISKIIFATIPRSISRLQCIGAIRRSRPRSTAHH